MEKIICSAIWYKDFEKPVHTVKNCETGVVLCGHRHPHIINQCTILLKKRQVEMGPYVQGFLTNDNRFVDREEGAEIAFKAGQTQKMVKTLYSEDLY